METRVALLAIIVKNPDAVGALNELLHRYGRHIIGRMGVPYPQRGVSIISIAMDAPADTISALSGKIGRAPRRHRQDSVRPGGGPGREIRPPRRGRRAADHVRKKGRNNP